MAIVDELLYLVGFEVDKTSMNKVNETMKGIASIGSKITAFTAAASAGLNYLVNETFVATASKFEQYRTILETTERSSEKAQKAMDWVSDFASKTPYELDEVMGAFVKLRAYGLEPTNGLLRTLGDTSAAMGKPLMQAVEAIADAVTGENERLKEFGIKARKEGNQIAYEFTDAAGKQQQKIVDASNRAMIQSTLEGIFNEKYSGQMGKLSKTWSGLVSNISDQWTRFQNMAMESGAFDVLKGKLEWILDQINQMADDGRLKMYAEQTGQAIIMIAKSLWYVFEGILFISRGIKFIIDSLGGFESIMRLIFAGATIYGMYQMVGLFGQINNLIKRTSFSIRGLLIGAGIGLLLIVLEDIYAWMSGKESITGMLLGDFEQWKKDMVGGFNALKESISGVWDSAVLKFEEFRAKIMGFFDYIRTNPIARAVVGGLAGGAIGGPIGMIAGAAYGYKSAPQAAAVTGGSTEVKIDVHGVSNPQDAANMVMTAIKQETTIGNQSYGVMAR